jgi:HEAT repeat protein
MSDQLLFLIHDPDPSVQCAACFGLAAIGDKKSIDALTEALLHGNELTQRAAAEALATKKDLGKEILAEAGSMDDLLVRRAVISGLLRIKSDWARDLLDKIQIEDSQWVVKDAAGQALESMALTDPHMPKRYLPSSQTAWLIAFAGEKGQGISPGDISLDLYLSAIQGGTQDQKLAAIDYLKQFGDASIVPLLKDIYSSDKGELKDAAYQALWQLSLCGYSV